MKKVIIGILSMLTGAAAGATGTGRIMKKEIEQKQQLSDKHLKLFKMMNQWVRVKQEGKSLVSYFEKKNIHKIAIYGMNYAGETLAEELKGSNVEIAYGIDKRANRLCAGFPIVLAEDSLEAVDAIVITAISFFDEIEQELSAKIDCTIISLEDIVYEV